MKSTSAMEDKNIFSVGGFEIHKSNENSHAEHFSEINERVEILMAVNKIYFSWLQNSNNVCPIIGKQFTCRAGIIARKRIERMSK